MTIARKDKNIFTRARWNKRKMTQGELADIMNVERLAVTNWENKKTKPDIHQVIRLSKVLDLNIEQIVLYYKESE